MTPAEYQEKQARRLKGAMEDMRRGVAGVTESPTAKAAAKQEKMLDRLTQSVQSGKWARGLRAVSTESWKQDMLEKGIPRVATGIDRAAPKVIDFATKFLPFVDRISSEVEAMPDMSLEDSIARATHAIRRMAEFKK